MFSHKFTSTDVDGVFSADPNVIKSAKLINSISYDEMLEAATAGAKVLHNRAVSMAKKYKLKLTVKNTRGENRGTIVTEEDTVDEVYGAKILAIKKELTKITIIGEHMYSNIDYIWKIYNIAKENNIIIHMLSFNETAINIIIEDKDSEKFSILIHEHLIA